MVSPFRINAFVWRAVNKAISVDARIRDKGVNLASKCSCCHHGAEEFINHLFFQSDCAISVWQYFAQIFGKPFHFHSMSHLFHTWMNGWSFRSQTGRCALAVMFNVLWEIWKSRCKARFEEATMNSVPIIRVVLKQGHPIRKINSNQLFTFLLFY